MDIIARWTLGDTVVERGIWRGKLWWACPSRVVQDTPELLAVYWPAGTPTLSPSPYPTPQDQRYNRIQLEDRNWTATDVLMLTTPGAAHSVYVMWEAGQRKQRCWYINLQEPIRRSPIGFDTMDQILDVVVSPDRSRWRWKDEDEFKQAEAIGVYTYEEARAIEAEGRRVIDTLRANASPFCDGWENWSPPADWTLPALPAGWENLPL